jgi:hypothetical protein
MRTSSLTNSKERVVEDQQLREKAFNDELAAIQRQEDAARNGGFWQDVENTAMTVAKVALVVGAVAGTVASAGTASPLLVCAALALSAGGMVVSETKAFGDASAGVAAGMEITAGVLTLGVGLASAAAPAASTAAVPAASSGSNVLGTVSTTANAVGSGAEVAGGAAHVVVGEYAAEAQYAAADVEQAIHQMDRMDRLVRTVIDNAKGDDKSREHTLASIQGAIQTNNETAIIAASISVKG